MDDKNTMLAKNLNFKIVFPFNHFTILYKRERNQAGPLCLDSFLTLLI